MAPMERDEVMKLVRDHLSTELEVAAEKIQPETRFREDLDADSLDLYELVMEPEDHYGIRVSEEEGRPRSRRSATPSTSSALASWPDLGEWAARSNDTRHRPAGGAVRGNPRRAALAGTLPLSWVEERTSSYGRLAFLGDSVLGLSVAGLLFSEHPEADIGSLPRSSTSGQRPRLRGRRPRFGAAGDAHRSLSSEGDGLPVETLLASERTLASVCEAVIGACYLDHGFQRTSAAVAAFDEEIEQATLERLDFKSELQERPIRPGGDRALRGTE